MFRQLDLFSAPEINCNRAVRLLLDLDAEAADTAFNEFERQYPRRTNLDLERSIIRFLKEPEKVRCLKGEPAEGLERWEKR